MARGERLTIIALSIISLALRSLAFFRYRFDSDEPQHLHVAWGWTVGLLQYRDIFDNHAPLFHMATAPILRAVGERDDVLLYMRAPMLLLFAIVLFATYVLGTRLYCRRVGAWSAVILSLLPPFFLKSLEYRTDNLWNAFWCLALVLLTGGEMTFARMFGVGLLLGFAFATSMKTSLLVFTLAAAALLTRAAFSSGRASRVVPLLLGLPVVPLMVVAYFAKEQALSNVVYCVIRFNELLTLTRSSVALWLPRAVWLPLMAIAIRVAWRKRPLTDDAATRWRFFFAFASAVFFITLIGFWILISPRDYLPFFPLLAIFAVAYVERRSSRPLAIYGAVAALFVVLIVRDTERFANHTQEQITMVHQVLRLTRPGEPVMDFKGETIYRPRPYYFIFEFITRNAMMRGLIRDTIPEDVVRRRCYVAQADGEFWPERGRAFLNTNFIDLGRLRAAGKWIKINKSFTIAVPGVYALVQKRNKVIGLLDGAAYAGPRYLRAGEHTFTGAAPQTGMACVWAPAIERGFSPFRKQDRDF